MQKIGCMKTMDSYLPDKNIIVVGYPRSGNTWLARLLGDVLSSPVAGWKAAKPLSEEGASRKGDYIVRQLHLQPMYENDVNEFMPSAYRANIPAWNGEKVIHIMRDPRDVAVSIMHYWNRPSISDTLDIMIEGKNPIKVHGPWLDFINKWMKVDEIPFVMITYEMLHENPQTVLELTLACLELPFQYKDIRKAVDNQSFDKKREHIRHHGGKYNYGRSIQLKAMRKGIVGDWVDHFSTDDLKKSYDAWSSSVVKFGYKW